VSEDNKNPRTYSLKLTDGVDDDSSTGESAASERLPGYSGIDDSYFHHAAPVDKEPV
jgi:hypothetical protein